MNKAFNSRSAAGLWNPSWAQADRDVPRWRHIHSETDRAVAKYLHDKEAYH